MLDLADNVASEKHPSLLCRKINEGHEGFREPTAVELISFCKKYFLLVFILGNGHYLKISIICSLVVAENKTATGGVDIHPVGGSIGQFENFNSNFFPNSHRTVL